MSHEPWKIEITGPPGTLGGLRAEVTKTRLTMRQKKECWVGTAKLDGKILECGSLPYDDALTFLLIFLVNRENEVDVDYWYVEEGFLVVRVEPDKVSRRIDKETGAFHLDITLNLTVTSLPDGVGEEEAIGDVMNFIFSDLTGEVTDDEPDQEILVRE